MLATRGGATHPVRARRGGKQRVRFSMVVRQEAVALAAVSGRAPDQFALDIRISKGALQRWTTIAVREQKASQRERRESELHEFDERLLMRGS